MNDIEVICTFLGGFGFFYLGIRFFSESFQRITSQLVKSVLNSLTSQPLTSLSVGFLVTCFVQGSSVTSVMAVSFVNGGLMELAQAMAFILGANIGATSIAWLMVPDMGYLAWLVVGIGIFIQLVGQFLDNLVGKDRIIDWGMMIWGLGFLWVGLEGMNSSFEASSLIKDYWGTFNIQALILVLFLGLVMSHLLGSSVVVVGLAMVAAGCGAMNLPMAFAFVLGANVGTTLGTLRVSVGTSTVARRLAFAHLFFKLTGVIILILFAGNLMLNYEGWQAVDLSHRSLYVAGFHTAFNLLNALLFLPLIPFIAGFVKRLIPDTRYKENKHLALLGGMIYIAPSLALVQSYQEIQKLIAMVQVVIDLTRECLVFNGTDDEVLNRVRKYEDITDNIQKEVLQFLGKVMSVRLSLTQARDVQQQISIVGSLEKIADACENIVEVSRVKIEENIIYNDDVMRHLTELFEKNQEMFEAYFYRVTGHAGEEYQWGEGLEFIDQKIIYLEEAYFSNSEELSAREKAVLYRLTDAGRDIKECVKELVKDHSFSKI